MKMEKCILDAFRILSVIALLMGSNAYAELVVIVNPLNGNTLDKGEIKRLYMGKRHTYPDGAKVVPIDQTENSAIREAFTSKVLEKNSQNMKSYWAKKVFTGQGNPPDIRDGDQKVKETVASDPAAIGYIDAANADDSIKIILTI